MNFVRVVPECGKWRLHTMNGEAVGPRLIVAHIEGVAPFMDICDTKDEAQDAAQCWNILATTCKPKKSYK